MLQNNNFQHKQTNVRLGRALVGSLLVFVAGLAACTDATVEAAVTKVANACAVSTARPSHRGLRRIEVADSNGNIKIHREQVFDDGAFDIGVDSTSVRNHDDPTPEELLAKLQGRFTYKYRDLAIDQVGALLQNYNVSVSDSVDSVAGRAVKKLTFSPRSGVALAYKTIVLADETTGFPLSVAKIDDNGQTIYQMIYETVEISNVQRTSEDPRTLPDAPTKQQNANAVGIEPLVATALPAGFRLSESSVASIELGARRAYYFVDRYTDGLQHLFVTQGDPKNVFIGEVPFVDSAQGMPTFAFTNVGAVSVVWGKRYGRGLASFGPYGKTTLGQVLAGYEPRR